MTLAAAKVRGRAALTETPIAPGSRVVAGEADPCPSCHGCDTVLQKGALYFNNCRTVTG